MIKLIMALLYFNMSCQINIGNIQFNTANAVEINQSIQELSDKAKVILPRNARRLLIDGVERTLEKRNVTDYIKVGDQVKIQLGYDNNNITEFEGYVTQLSSDIPLVIECEDEMYKLKKTTFNTTLKDATLLDLLKLIAPGYTYEVIDDIKLGKFIIENASAYEALEALRSDYLMHSYFKGKTLVVGFPSSFAPQEKLVYNLKQVRSKSDLQFVRKDDLKLQIKAISNNSDGSKKVVTVGETGGSVRTLNFMNKTEAELKQLANSNLKSLSFDGYQGSFDAIGTPSPKAGYSCELVDDEYTERTGVYLIEGVTKLFNGSDGYKNVIKLSLKIS